MTTPLQSPVHNQIRINVLNLLQNKENVWCINGRSIYHNSMENSVVGAPSEYLSRQKLRMPEEVVDTKKFVIVSIPSYRSRGYEDTLLSERPLQFYDEKPLQDLEHKIIQVHDEHQTENWDGYGAKPVQNLSQALHFAKALFQESRLFVEKVDITPENDSAICFEWFLSNEQYVAISVKNDKLIYHYQSGEGKGCGETNFFGKQMLFEKIKQMGYGLS